MADGSVIVNKKTHKPEKYLVISYSIEPLPITPLYLFQPKLVVYNPGGETSFNALSRNPFVDTFEGYRFTSETASLLHLIAGWPRHFYIFKRQRKAAIGESNSLNNGVQQFDIQASK